MLEPEDLRGQKFNRLVVISIEPKERLKEREWLCLCDCGNKIIVKAARLKNGHTKSCGCWNRQHAKEMGRSNAIHGLSATKLYSVWNGMVTRCERVNSKYYPHYGGRGIKICERWRKDFLAFVADMGPSYQRGLTLERIDFDGDYSPENCRWATLIEQARNKRDTFWVEYKGKRMSLPDAVEKYSTVSYKTVADRIRRYGWSVEQALLIPIRKGQDYLDEVAV